MSSPPLNFTAAYVITSNGRDIHADMALVSMMSVRISNPGLRIVAVCDSPSAQAIRASGHRMLEVCDELIAVDTPDGEPVFRNRWIKTQLGHFVEGDFLFLDGDTLVRRSLRDLPALVRGFGGVSNHNGATFVEQIWEQDHEYLRQMGWQSEFDKYFNGGVWYVSRSILADGFFDIWNRLWLDGVQKNGRWQDQPSLNTALRLSGIDLALLPESYNAQVRYNWRAGRDAHVWHFYNSMELSDTCFPALLKHCGKPSDTQLRRAVVRALHIREPWPNQDLISRIVVDALAGQPGSRPCVAAELWLINRRLDALRYTLGGIRAVILDNSVT